MEQFGVAIGGWTGQSRSGKKIFSQGWNIVERSDAPKSQAILTEPAATLNFRLPYRRRYRHKQGVQFALRTAEDRPLAARVVVNGQNLGVLIFPQDTICFPVELCEPLDEVTIRLEPLGVLEAQPPVLAIEALSLKAQDDLEFEVEADPEMTTDDPDDELAEDLARAVWSGAGQDRSAAQTKPATG